MQDETTERDQANEADGAVEEILELPDDWWQEEVVAKTLSHSFSDHIVGIELMCTTPSGPKCEMMTGFLMQIDSLCLWITAGHTIEYFRDILTNTQVRLVSSKLVDNCKNRDAAGIPLSLTDDMMYSAGEDMDFGAIALRPGYAAPLLGNPGVRPLTPESWRGHESCKPEGYYLVGIPNEWCTSEEVRGSSEPLVSVARCEIACIPLIRIQPPKNAQPVEFWDDPSAFYAELLPITDNSNHTLESIKGMSGGPIVSIERTSDGQLKYRLFAVQSKWLGTSRMLRAEPIGRIIDVIAQGMEQAAIRYRSDQGEPREEGHPRPD